MKISGKDAKVAIEAAALHVPGEIPPESSTGRGDYPVKKKEGTLISPQVPTSTFSFVDSHFV